MLGKAAAIALALLLVSPAAANASGWRFDDRDSHPRRHHDSQTSWSHWVSSHDDEDSDDSEDSDQDSPAIVSDDAGAAGGSALTGTPQTMQVETTSYNFEDNAGSNNATICCPKLHRVAGGNGSYADPITLAVPGSGGSGMQTPAGTRVYFEKYQFYGIVEDSGASPKSLRRFDIWSDGRGMSTSAGSDCMDALTGTSTAILNPPAGKPVPHVGPRGDASGCHVATSGS